MGKIIQFALIFIAICIVLAGGYFFNLINSSSYDEFILFVADLIQKPDWITQLKGFFSIQDFNRVYSLRYLVLFVTLLFALAIVFTRKFISRYISLIVSYIKQQSKNLLNSYRDLPILEKSILTCAVLFFLFKSYYYVFNWPMQYDEAWTFNYFIKNSWLTTLVAPHNNFILYSIVAKLFYHLLPFIEPISAIRLPLPLFALATGLILFYTLNKLYTTRLAILTFIIFLNVPAITFYSLYARGYMLEVFFVAVQFCILLAIINRKKFHLQFKILLVLSTIFAMYSAPIYIYSGLFLYLILGGYFIVQREFNNLKTLILLGFVSIIGTLLLYSPQILGTKLSWLTEAVSSSKTFDLYKALSTFSEKISAFLLTGRNKYIFPIFLIVFIISMVSFYKRAKFLWWILLSQLIAPLIIITLQKQLLYERIFAHTSIFIAVAIAFIIYNFIKNRILSYSLSIVICGYLAYAAHHEKYMTWSYEYDVRLEKIAEHIKEQGYEEVYNFFHYAKPALEYYAYVEKFPLKIYMWTENSRDYAPFDKRMYDCVLVEYEYRKVVPESLEGYEETWRDGPTVIYTPTNNPEQAD